MNRARILLYLARADFLERIRQYSFLFVLAATTYLGYSFYRGDVYLELDGYRGLMNSAWAGGMMATSTSLVLSLFGFYLVKNSIERDMRTGVGQIIATTPVSRLLYLFGKWLSNWGVLSLLVGIMAVTAVLLQVLGGESARVDPVALIVPFLALTLPSMAFVAALALLFETNSWSRGGVGNAVYFFLWMAGLVIPLLLHNIWLDWSGIMTIAESMGDGVRAINPAYNGDFSFTTQPLPEGGLRTFVWSGIEWTMPLALVRLLWMVFSLGVVALGSVFFHRFDPSREKQNWRQERTEPGEPVPVKAPVHGEHAAPARLSALPPGALRYNFFRALGAELRLMLRGQPWWWYAGGAIMLIGEAVSPLSESRRGWLPAAWLWPLLLWSSMGTRETYYRTSQLLFSSPHPLPRQLPTAWCAGLIVTLACGSGTAVNALWHADGAALLALVAGAVFIPSLALSLGVWSGSSRLFEITYLLLWYLGPLHPFGMPHLDFMGATDASLSVGAPASFALCAAILLGAAALGRWRQLQG
jgi:ABC-type transport system involved in multi-copper enzyme maturation permease subunit